jgi:hypothetical protein
MARWLSGLDEANFAFGDIAHGQLLVAPPRDDCDSDCEDVACEDGESALSGIGEVRDACAQLVTVLPAACREAVRKDAEALAGIFMRLCPDVPWLTLRLEIVQHEACWRWHQDAYTGRAIICYVGPGTCASDDTSVCWDQFEKTRHDNTNESCVPKEGIKQMKTNAVLLMKGDSWPGIRGKGLTHRSPGVPGDASIKRMLLKVDLTDFRPPLGSESESESEWESESEKTEEQEERPEHTSHGRVRSVALKRLATSQGFQSVKASKHRR